MNKAKSVSLLIGFALVFIGIWIENSTLIFSGVGMLGVYSILLGMEAIQHRRISLETDGQGLFGGKYLEWADVAQGILFISLGTLLLAFTASAFLGISQSAARFLIRRPGPVFLALSAVCILRALIVFAGSGLTAQPKKPFEWIDVFFSNLLPAGALTFLGLFLAGLGLLEFLSPGWFYQLSGGILDKFIGGW